MGLWKQSKSSWVKAFSKKNTRQYNSKTSAIELETKRTVLLQLRDIRSNRSRPREKEDKTMETTRDRPRLRSWREFLLLLVSFIPSGLMMMTMGPPFLFLWSKISLPLTEIRFPLLRARTSRKERHTRKLQRKRINDNTRIRQPWLSFPWFVEIQTEITYLYFKHQKLLEESICLSGIIIRWIDWSSVNNSLVDMGCRSHWRNNPNWIWRGNINWRSRLCLIDRWRNMNHLSRRRNDYRCRLSWSQCVSNSMSNCMP